MPDLLMFTTATAGCVIAVVIVTAIIRELLEASILPPTNKAHDSLIRILVFVVAAALIEGARLMLPGSRLSGPMFGVGLIEAGKAAGIAIATYHVATADFFKNNSLTAILGFAGAQNDPPPESGQIVDDIAMGHLAALPEDVGHMVAPPIPPEAFARMAQAEPPAVPSLSPRSALLPLKAKTVLVLTDGAPSGTVDEGATDAQPLRQSDDPTPDDEAKG